MPAFRPVALLAATLVAAPAAARAQGACDINEGSPFQINSARLYLSKVGTTTSKASDTKMNLKNAVRVLTQGNGDFGNPVGKNYELGRALYEWARVAPYDSTLMAPRSELGYANDGPAMVDIGAAMDTAFAVVEKAQPTCAAKTKQYRQYVFSQLYNRALAMSNAENVDSARKLVARAQLIDPNAIGTYQLNAILAQKTNDQSAMLSAYATVLAKTTAGDSATAAYRKTALNNSAVILQQQASAATGAEKQALTDRSVALFKQYADEFKGDSSAAAGLAKAQLASGDAAAVASVYQTMLASPDKYTDTQLFEAATSAQVAKQYATAQQLYNEGLKKNPYYRDALFNLANSYVSTRDGDKMLPVAMRLLAAEPNSALNDSIVADAYRLKARSTTDSKLKLAYADSIKAYMDAASKGKAQVVVSTFTHATNGKHTVGGTLKNVTSASATFTVTVDFLDASGSAVGTQTAKVGPVAAGATQPFSVSVTQPGVVAWRVRVQS